MLGSQVKGSISTLVMINQVNNHASIEVFNNRLNFYQHKLIFVLPCPSVLWMLLSPPAVPPHPCVPSVQPYVKLSPVSVEGSCMITELNFI